MLLTYMVALGQLVAHHRRLESRRPIAVLTGGAPFGDYLLRFLLPTLIGNTIGGVSLVALVNHAAIAPDSQGGQPSPS